MDMLFDHSFCFSCSELKRTKNTYSEFIKKSTGEAYNVDPEKAITAVKKSQFKKAVVTTVNRHALLSGRGDKLKWEAPDLSMHPGEQLMTLKIEPGDIAAAVVSSDYLEEDIEYSLNCFSYDGYLKHRIAFTNDVPSKLAFENIAVSNQQPIFFDTFGTENIISLSVVRDLRKNWDRNGISWHLQSLLVDQGRSRRQMLPTMDTNKARRLVPEIVGPLLLHLYQVGMIYVRGLPHKGLLHTDASDVLQLEADDDYIFIYSNLGAAVFNQSNIGSCWETKFDDKGNTVSFVEIYSHCGRCIAVLMPYRNYLLRQWLEITASLPSEK